jgi:hypothetical protein
MIFWIVFSAFLIMCLCAYVFQKGFDHGYTVNGKKG